MCIFCRIAAGEIPASIVYEDDRAMAFLDIQPVTPGHVLVVPKRHANTFIELPPVDAGHLFRVGQIIDYALRNSELRCEGVDILLADGRAAGQDVNHVHLHVFPRYEGDGVGMLIHSGSNKQPGREELDADAEKIRRAMHKIYQFV